jgi:hypothetical protein
MRPLIKWFSSDAALVDPPILRDSTLPRHPDFY